MFTNLQNWALPTHPETPLATAMFSLLDRTYCHKCYIWRLFFFHVLLECNFILNILTLFWKGFASRLHLKGLYPSWMNVAICLLNLEFILKPLLQSLHLKGIFFTNWFNTYVVSRLYLELYNWIVCLLYKWFQCASLSLNYGKN